MAVEGERLPVNPQLCAQGERQETLLAGVLLPHADGLCPGEQQRVASRHRTFPQQGQQNPVGQVPVDAPGLL